MVSAALQVAMLLVKLVLFVFCITPLALVGAWRIAMSLREFFPWLPRALAVLPLWRSPTAKLRLFAEIGDVQVVSGMLGGHTAEHVRS